MSKKPDQNYSAEESRERFEAALRGARVSGPKHKTAVKTAKKQRKKRT